MFNRKSKAIGKLQIFCATWQQLQICAIMSFNNKWLRSIKPRANKYVLTLKIPTRLSEQGEGVGGQLPPLPPNFGRIYQPGGRLGPLHYYSPPPPVGILDLPKTMLLT